MTEPQTIPDPQVDLTEEVFEDYFGFEDIKTFVLPKSNPKAKDQFIYFRVMNEGDRSKFQSKVNRDITVVRQTGDAKIGADPAAERLALLEASVTGWTLKRRTRDGSGWEDAPFSIGSKGDLFEQWLQKADPKLVDALEMEIRKANPWMQADMTVEDINKEIDRLVELREGIEKRDAGEDSSSGK
jgi:hypothetical protein